MSQLSDVYEIQAPMVLRTFFSGKPPRLWSVGNPAILNRRLLGIISARQIDSDLALKSSQLLKQLASLKEIGFVSGWHSPLEEEALRVLLNDAARIVFCVPKALNRFVPPVGIEIRINQKEALLLTHCSPKAKRISRDASIRRNHLVVGLASALLALSAPSGTASLNLAKVALRHGKPVFTPEHRLNQGLLGIGALPATLESIKAAWE